MRRARGGLPLIAAALSYAAAFVPSPEVLAQSATADMSGEERVSIIHVPAFVGALSVDGALVGRFLGRPELPDGWTVTAGYRHFFDGWGRLSLRPHALFERGSLLNPHLSGEYLKVGAGAELIARGFNEKMAFGSIGILLQWAGVSFKPPSLGLGSSPDARAGWEATVGLTTTLGSLFVLDPYLFAETGAAITLSMEKLGGSTAAVLGGRWLFRFDWAVRGRVD